MIKLRLSAKNMNYCINNLHIFIIILLQNNMYYYTNNLKYVFHVDKPKFAINYCINNLENETFLINIYINYCVYNL